MGPKVANVIREAESILSQGIPGGEGLGKGNFAHTVFSPVEWTGGSVPKLHRSLCSTWMAGESASGNRCLCNLHVITLCIGSSFPSTWQCRSVTTKQPWFPQLWRLRLTGSHTEGVMSVLLQPSFLSEEIFHYQGLEPCVMAAESSYSELNLALQSLNLDYYTALRSQLPKWLRPPFLYPPHYSWGHMRKTLGHS